MRTVFITEGEGEYAALPLLKHQIQERTGIHLIPPMRITIQPDGPATKIGRSIKEKLLPTLMAKQVEKAVVLLDREMRGDCPGEFAIEVLAAVRSLCGTGIDFTVVLKDRCFENWLVADVQSLKAQPGRLVKSLGSGVTADPSLYALSAMKVSATTSLSVSGRTRTWEWARPRARGSGPSAHRRSARPGRRRPGG